MIPTALLQFAVDSCQKSGDFFGLIPWYHYLPSKDFGGSAPNACDINDNFNVFSGGKSDFTPILLAVVDDLLRIAGIVAVGFVIYGAFQYTYSQGNPEQTSKAQSTITNALIGLAIAVTAIAGISFLGSRLGG